MSDIKTTPVDPRMAWDGAELQQTSGWIDTVDAAEFDELRRAADRLPSDPAQWPCYGPGELPLPTFGARIARMADELENGRGFILMRGLDTRGSEAELRRWYWVIGAHFGEMVAQNAKGDLIAEVTDRGGRYGEDPHARGYTSNAEMRFHSDVADVVSLLCVRAAAEGGESEIVSTMTIYNRLLDEAPHVLETLYRGFNYYVRLTETAPGGEEKGRVGPVRDAAYIHADGRLTGGINPQSIRSLPEVTGEPIPAEELEALETVERIAESPGLSLRFAMRPGDLLLVDNYMVLHKRTQFVDFPEPSRKRLLLRLWLNLHNGRALPVCSAKAIHREAFGRPAKARTNLPGS
ncbi:MAG: TauD/TfdA family dioxygenase [Phenylobacterium sp.]|uniref:TauD/TfdA family dioxygenase n=1 Tax=Phenylobacterium sp. TaxID=1871053 RepID=UPI002736DEB0|nr:TauD/TfdA family dioxygenase [Phenylobacterium sp.]MDP3747671.1 TauD/TfdA family dioxygenase [Phenylobacterium sp.]